MTTTPKSFISALVTPGAGSTSAKKSWAIDVETVWVPFFTATNAMRDTNLAPETLGAPIRLGLQKDGSVRFSSTGRPVMRVAPELTAQIAVVRQNFIASLQAYTGEVMAEQVDAYRGQIEANQQAGTVLLEHDARLLQADLERQELASVLAAEQAECANQATPPAADADAPEPETPAPTGRGRRTGPRTAPRMDAVDDSPVAPELAEATTS